MQIYVLELIGDKAQRESFNMQIRTSFLENICTCIKEPTDLGCGDGEMNDNPCSCRLMGPGSPAAERVAGTPGRFSHAGLALRTALSVRRRHKDSGLQGLRGRSCPGAEAPPQGVTWSPGGVARSPGGRGTCILSLNQALLQRHLPTQEWDPAERAGAGPSLTRPPKQFCVFGGCPRSAARAGRQLLRPTAQRDRSSQPGTSSVIRRTRVSV